MVRAERQAAAPTGAQRMEAADPATRFREAVALIRDAEIGRGTYIEAPFGRRLICYADLTATGRHLEFVDRWLDGVRPLYANTHTTISASARAMTEVREEARRVVARAVNAGPRDVVVFTGSGATCAVNELVGVLGLRIPEPLEREYGFARQIPPERRPVVLVGPYEHHSNELPWLESIAEVVEIDLDAAGRVDLQDLARQLARFAERPLKIGALSAASNVTGVLTDVAAVARILHDGGAYACFDYAAAGPYVPIDMHPADPAERIDALFLSTHKFPGGPAGSGVLVAHRDLFRCRVPVRPGGGTVEFVSAAAHESVDYVHRLDEREEGGTPAILGDVRAAVAFLVKEMAGPAEILRHEVALARRACDRLRQHPNIRLLGSHELPRLSILSFNVQGLHHDLVATLLDHLFGIQNRAGCSCAGPYGHRLLGIDPPRSEKYRRLIAEGFNGIRPGWVRASLPYYAAEDEIEFILRAIEFVADHGLDFVPAYRLGWGDGVWRAIGRPNVTMRPLDLTVQALRDVALRPPPPVDQHRLSEAEIAAERARYFDEARVLADRLRERWTREPPRWNEPTGRADIDELVSFRYVHTDWPGAVPRSPAVELPENVGPA
jgi:selenocysteine lyase/cysteine desulfurase